MNDDEKAGIDEIANSLQVIKLLSTRFDTTSASQRSTQSISRAQRLGPFVP